MTHLILPIPLPTLEHLTDDELSALQAKFTSAAREARRKANASIQRDAALRLLYMRTLGKEPAEEDVQAFEQRLLRNPEAYIAYAYANALIHLDTTCRNESLRRHGTDSRKSKRKPEVMLTKPLSEHTPDVLTKPLSEHPQPPEMLTKPLSEHAESQGPEDGLYPWER